MSRAYQKIRADLKLRPRKWLVTGVAGFIGSNILEALLNLEQEVVGLDNFATGFQHNLDQVQASVGAESWKKFKFIKGDILNLSDCRKSVEGVNCVLHQAALGSVPRSIEDPIMTNATNISGFLNMLVAARDANVDSFTYAASSSTYGDHEALPKVEGTIGNPLSPYAVTKYVNELYANVFARTYGFKCIGLRYFNIFGRRQDPNGAYAAVVPKWINAILSNETVMINGDGETSRDFCYVDNAVQMNLLAAVAPNSARDEIYNVAFNARTSLNELFLSLKTELKNLNINYNAEPVHVDFRKGDVRHSQADIFKARDMLGYNPDYDIDKGLHEVMPWYLKSFSDNSNTTL